MILMNLLSSLNQYFITFGSVNNLQQYFIKAYIDKKNLPCPKNPKNLTSMSFLINNLIHHHILPRMADKKGHFLM